MQIPQLYLSITDQFGKEKENNYNRPHSSQVHGGIGGFLRKATIDNAYARCHDNS